MTIWFDMDGTIADLYGVEGWLEKLIASDATPYEIAKPLLRLATLARTLNQLQRKGYKIGVISWLSKDPNPTYGAKVTAAKYYWLEKHLPSVNFDEIRIVPYGTPKSTLASEIGILFDDEEPNRKEWEEAGGVAYDAQNILKILSLI
jgi:hypothetical protein